MSNPSLQHAGVKDSQTRELLALLMHRVRNETQFLLALRETIGELGAPEALERHDGHLEGSAGKLEELGWLLGVLSGPAGTDLLGERREPEGLAPLLGLVREALRRDGRDLGEPPHLPGLAPATQPAWLAPWTVASLLFAAARGCPEGSCLTWSLKPAGPIAELRARSPVTEELRGAAHRALADGETGELISRDREWKLSLPGSWFVFES